MFEITKKEIEHAKKKYFENGGKVKRLAYEGDYPAFAYSFSNRFYSLIPKKVEKKC